MVWKRLVGVVGAALLGSSLVTASASAGSSGPSYTTINYPGAALSFATDINASGQIVGEYSFDGLNDRQGYLMSNGHFTSITFPGSIFTRAIGINQYGAIVGDYVVNGSGSSNEHGYLLLNGAFTSIEFPSASQTIAAGINKNGDTVGWYFDQVGTHGFLLRGGAFSSIDFPGSDAFTQTYEINDVGEIAGRYKSVDGHYHIFTLTNGTFTPVADVPGALQTAPGGLGEKGGLNNNGDLTGTYCSFTPCAIRNAGAINGFLLTAGSYTTVGFPGAADTVALGLNSSGDIVGGYTDATGIHGYLRTP